MLDCEMFSRLALVLTKKANEVWYKERFFTCMLTDEYKIQISKQERYYDFSDYSEVLDMESLDCNKIDHQHIIHKIDSGMYIRALIDRYYLPDNKDYQANHITHDVNIYGYDSTKQCFLFFEHQINNKQWGESTIQYDAFYKAFEKGLLTLFNNNSFLDRELYFKPIYSLRIKETDRKKPSIEHLYHEITNWLNNKQIIKTEQNDSIKTIFNYGLSIYRRIYEDFCKDLEQGKFDYLDSFVYFFRNFLSVKEFLVDKLEFYNMKTEINFPNEYVQQAKELSLDVKRVFMLLTRYLILKETSVLNEIINRLKKAELADFRLLESLKIHIFKHSTSELSSKYKIS